MKKILPAILLFLGLMLAWETFFDGGMSFSIDGEQFDGPFGELVGALFGIGGVLVAALVLLIVGVVLVVVFAGLGIMLLIGLVIGAVLLALLVSPLLLPLFIVVAIVWAMGRRKHAPATATAPAA